MGPMLAPWTLLSGSLCSHKIQPNCPMKLTMRHLLWISGINCGITGIRVTKAPDGISSFKVHFCFYKDTCQIPFLFGRYHHISASLTPVQVECEVYIYHIIIILITHLWNTMYLFCLQYSLPRGWVLQSQFPPFSYFPSFFRIITIPVPC